jgi:hypothetical protein
MSPDDCDKMTLTDYMHCVDNIPYYEHNIVQTKEVVQRHLSKDDNREPRECSESKCERTLYTCI